jgi:negative regulator of flagellin synthesis FlgM
MKVNGSNGPIRPGRDGSPPGQPAVQGERGKKESALRTERLDRVEISAAGRARSGEVVPLSSSQPDRLAEIRRRLLAGAYDTNEVVDAVARRILDRGDI